MSKARDLRVVKALYFFYYASYGLFLVFVNIHYHNIGLSGVQIGWINSLAPLMGILGGPLWGMLNDRLGRPRLLMGLAVLGSIGAVAGVSFVRAFVWLLPLAGGFMLFSSVLGPMTDMINLTVLGEHKERYGQQRIFGTISYIIVTWILGQVIDRAGMQWMFYTYYGLMLSMLAVTTFLPSRRVQAQSSEPLNVRVLVGQRPWLFFAASMVPLWMAFNGMNTFLGVYLREMGASQSLVGLNSSLGAVSEMPVMLFSVFFVSRLGLKRMLWISYVMFALRMLLYGLIPTPGWALPISLMHGLTFGLFWVSGVMYVNKLAPPNLSTTSQTLFFALTNLAGVIGAPIGGWIFDNIGPAQLFRFYAVLCVLALGILLAGFRSEQKKMETVTPELEE